MNTRESNYRQVTRYLAIAGVLLGVASFFIRTELPKDICFGLAMACLSCAVTVAVVNKMRPGSFRD